MYITMQDEIDDTLEKLVMEKTTDKNLIAQLTSTIKQLAKINKILTDQIKTLTEKNTKLTENYEYQQKQGGKATTGYCYK